MKRKSKSTGIYRHVRETAETLADFQKLGMAMVRAYDPGLHFADIEAQLTATASENVGMRGMVKQATEELANMRRAIDAGWTAQAALYGYRLGRRVEMLHVVPVEPDAAEGKAVQKRRARGTRKGNDTQKQLAANRRRRIIDFAKANRNNFPTTGHWISHIANEQKCSETTVRKALKQIPE